MTIKKRILPLVTALALGGPILFGVQKVSGQDTMGDFMFDTPSVTLSFTLGYGVRSAGSDLFDELVREFTLEKGDFHAPVIGGGLSFFLDDRIDLNLGTGLYVMPIEYGLAELGDEFTKEDITAPLPVISVGFDLAITPKWFLKQGLDMMYLKLGDFEGRILDTHLAVEYRGWKNVALGAGIDGILVKIDAEDETDYPGIDMVGVVKFSYIGALAYVKFYY